MKIIEHKNFVEITEIEAFNPKHTFECGQCFRWFSTDDNKYKGVAYNKEVEIWYENNSLFITCSLEDFQNIWCKYLDLDRKYLEITEAFKGDDFFQEAVTFGMGLRLLKQEPWEALCSFIISQCNNISRIQKIIDSLCKNFGKNMGDYYAFPTASEIAALELSDLDVIKSGYRAKYIYDAAKKVACGDFDFSLIEAMDTETARKYTLSLNGVGRKVADCFLLFGMAKYDAFPVDTWMKKAEEHYDKKNYGSNFGAFAGIAQQYIFYYARSGQKK